MEIPNQMPDGYLESFVQSHSVERTDGHCLKSQSHWDRSILGKLRIVAGFRKLQYEMVSRRISGERTPSHSLWHHGPPAGTAASEEPCGESIDHSQFWGRPYLHGRELESNSSESGAS